MKSKFYFLNITMIFIGTICSGQNLRDWATYYGGTGNDGAFSVATDNSGNVFIAGITMSPSGIASGGFQNTFGGGVVDAYLVKFDSVGNRLWATYYGGAGDEMAFLGGKLGIATDANGNVYLAGFTTSTTGIASGGFQNSPGGNSANAYLVKFDTNGNRIWGTYYGGTSVDKAYNVATDASGNVYLAGIANSAGLASNGFQNTGGGLSDALLVKFDTNGNRLWATYYGGLGTDEGYSVTTDNASNVYLAGTTNSSNAIASGGFQNTFAGANDLFLVKFDSAGIRLWATYYGGPSDEMVLFSGDVDVATDLSGNVFLTGLTTSTTGISSTGAHQASHGGGDNDAFLVKFDSAGNREWATYYGGTDDDKGFSVTTDATGHVYLAGRTDSFNAIATGGFQNNLAGPMDAFLVKFDTDGTRECATYFGGVDMDECNAIAVDAASNIYLAGNSANTNGIAWNGFQNSHGGGVSDAFLVKFKTCPTVTALTEISNDANILVYPNPSHDHFTIEINGINTGVLRIYNGLGQLKFYLEEPGHDQQINLHGFQKGIYFLKADNGTRLKILIN